ncbi:glycogen-binding domain-containing protein [Thermodesulfobacteriota bacterium]
MKRQKVTFSLKAIDATEVILMGDFNRWNPKKHPMKRDENGVWEKAVIIPPGKYEYKFLVDGRWKEDPQNDQRCSNCYGTYNNVLNVSAK